MQMDTFQVFPKIARYSREVIVTEKIDGTNAQILVWDETHIDPLTNKQVGPPPTTVPWFVSEGSRSIAAGSRKRFIVPEDDNYGFAKWVKENSESLMTLGHGTHYGEWWGQGIQRNYGLKEKRFSMFNVSRWVEHGETPQTIPTADPRIVKLQEVLPPEVHLVPLMWRGLFDELNPQRILDDLEKNGSQAAPGFESPEGIVIFHTASGAMFKKTLVGDEKPKGAE
jgi:hypothetical protein